jgi:phosphoribosylaminoimidazolecarboxamide formyltransferase/IMP cyclohydrolase
MFNSLSEKGKELSYNNLVDVDAAVALIDEFTEPTVAILKHTNACGVATRQFIKEAWIDALACDPVSAFGGVIITNAEIDAETAAEIDKLFYEVLIAPAYTDEAIAILTARKGRIVLVRQPVELPLKQFKTLLNGVIEQDKDLVIEGPADMKTVTERQPTEQELKDLFIANKIAKNTKSNAIVLVKNNQMLSLAVLVKLHGLMRLQQALAKAAAFGFDVKGVQYGIRSFFPFPDCVEIAADAGIIAVLQPGGSIKDQLSIDMANQKGISMVNRHTAL